MGKKQKLDIPFAANVLGLVGPGGLIGDIFGQGGQTSAQSFAGNFLSTIASWASTGLKAIGIDVGGSFISNILGGIVKAGGPALILGGLTGSIGGAAGAFAGGLLGSTVSRGFGSAIVNAIFGNFFQGLTDTIGNLILPGLGFALGFALEELFGGLFEHIPTKGTQIRKGVTKWLKEIDSEFRGQIDANTYGFEWIKAYAKRTNTDFLEASRHFIPENFAQVVTEGLDKQLLAIGLAVTSTQAGKLGKSLEQTGQTFANMIVANLGGDISRITEFIADTVQKAKINFAGLVESINEAFQKSRIGADTYKNALEGAVQIFFKDWPKAIDIMHLVNQSMKDGVLDVKRFQQKVQDVVGLFQTMGQAAADAVGQGLAGGLKGTDVAAIFEKNFLDQLRAAIVNAVIQQTITAAFTTAFVDALAPVQDIIRDFLAGKLSLDEFTTKFTSAMDAARPAIHAMAEALGVSYDVLVDVLRTADLLPDSFKDAAGAAEDFGDAVQRALGSGITTALEEGFRQGLSGPDLLRHTNEVLQKAIRDAIFQGFVDGFVKAALADAALAEPLAKIQKLIHDYVAGTISLSTFESGLNSVLSDSRGAFERLSQAIAAASPEVRTFLITVLGLPDPLNASADAAHHLSSEAQGLVDQIRELNRQIDELQQKRISLQIDFASSLAQIGAISPLDLANLKISTAQSQLDQLLESGSAHSPIGTRPLLGLSDAQLQRAIDLNEQLIQATIEKYNAEVAGIQETLQAQLRAIDAAEQAEIQRIHDAAQAQIDAVNANLQATIDAITAQYQAQKDAVNATIQALQDEKQRVQELFQARLDALNKELQIAQSFKQTAESIGQVIAQIMGAGAAAPNFDFLRRQAALLRQQIAMATPEAQPALMQQLAQVLQQELQAGGRIFGTSSIQYQTLLTSTLTELQDLQVKAAEQGAKAAQIQQQILETQIAEKAALASIDAQIQSQQNLLKQLDQDQQAAINSARASAQEQIRQIQAAATLQVQEAHAGFEAQRKAVKEAADAQIAALRADVAQRLTDLYAQQDDFIKERIRRREEQKQQLTDQLTELIGINKATTLLADPANGLIFTTQQVNTTLGTMNTNLSLKLDTISDLISDLASKITPAQHGFAGLVSHPALFSVAEHGPEYVRIGAPRANTSVSPSPRSEDKIEVHIDLGGIHVSVNGSGYTRQDAEQIAEMIERRINSSLQQGRLRTRVQEIIRGY